jgi:CRISPR-associated protein Csm3
MWKKNIVMRVEFELVTGLHIGGLGSGLRIGGSDNPVIKSMMNYQGRELEVPYIPGSSIKGKMRSLLLSVYGKVSDKKVDFPADRRELLNLFGRGIDQNYAGEDGKADLRRTRLVIRDAMPDDASIKKALELEGFTEVKGENTINPITGEANPRFMDRIVPGMKFSGEIILQIMDGDIEEKYLQYLNEGLKLIEDSYLGGQGSRGYGKVRIKVLSNEYRDLDYYVRVSRELSQA